MARWIRPDASATSIFSLRSGQLAVIRSVSSLLPLAVLSGIVVPVACWSGQVSRPKDRPVRIAAASDLRFCFADLERAFRVHHSKIALDPVFGASGHFFAQITEKARFDLFLSADLQYPRQLVDQGIARDTDLFPYGRGRIVVWVPNSSAVEIEKDGLRSLTSSSVDKIAIANPRFAPYGRAADAALRRAGIYDHVADRLVLGENVAQAAQFVESGAAQAGIIALSVASAAIMKERGRFWVIPEELHDPLEQGGVILDSENRAHAVAFRDFLVSPAAQGILRQHGLMAPSP